MATQYFISPTGLDTNSGLSSGLPWLTPNHAVNCGDTITAATGTYTASNFGSGKWGTVTCAAANNVAWLQCATFDGCKITATSGDGMWVSSNFWGVQGWEVTTTTSTNGACFHVGPASSGVVHHVIFANDVANGCKGGGFNAYDLSTTASVDYIVYIGNIAYNSTSGTTACYSGFNIYQPIASDGVSGTHMFVAGNFSWGNTDGNNCGGNSGTTDGEGINFDTWDFSQGGGTAYTQQGLIQNNIEFSNGGEGILVENNTAGGGSHANIYIKNNTMYGSGRDPNAEYPSGKAELAIYKASNITATANLVYSGFRYSTSTNAYYALGVSTSDATDTIDYNYASGVSGNDTFLYSSGSFAYGTHGVTGTNPVLTGTPPTTAPSCGSNSSVPNCMATVIADVVPTATGASAYGYTAVSNTSIADALFPTWLCNGNALITGIPSNLITPGCGVAGGGSTVSTQSGSTSHGATNN